MLTQIKVFTGVEDAKYYRVNSWLEENQDIEVIDIKITSVNESKNGMELNYLQYTVIYKKKIN